MEMLFGENVKHLIQLLLQRLSRTPPQGLCPGERGRQALRYCPVRSRRCSETALEIGRPPHHTPRIGACEQRKPVMLTLASDSSILPISVPATSPTIPLTLSSAPAALAAAAELLVASKVFDWGLGAGRAPPVAGLYGSLDAPPKPMSSPLRASKRLEVGSAGLDMPGLDMPGLDMPGPPVPMGAGRGPMFPSLRASKRLEVRPAGLDMPGPPVPMGAGRGPMFPSLRASKRLEVGPAGLDMPGPPVPMGAGRGPMFPSLRASKRLEVGPAGLDMPGPPMAGPRTPTGRGPKSSPLREAKRPASIVSPVGLGAGLVGPCPAGPSLRESKRLGGLGWSLVGPALRAGREEPAASSGLRAPKRVSGMRSASATAGRREPAPPPKARGPRLSRALGVPAGELDDRPANRDGSMVAAGGSAAVGAESSGAGGSGGGPPSPPAAGRRASARPVRAL